MTNQELFNELKEYVEESLNRVHVGNEKTSLNNGSCYTSSKIACKILQKLGYDCNVQRVQCIAGNEIGRKIFLEQAKTDSFDKEKIIKAGGWVVGLGVGDNKDYFHYIVAFPSASEPKEIMDITFGQANRPEHNVICEPYWVGVEDLPETIVLIKQIKGKNARLNPLINAPETKDYFKKVISKGIKLLKRYKK